MEEQFLDWAIELQALAQAGLTYTKDIFDQERFERIRTIATEMLASQSPLPTAKVRELFATETGYPTPKLDTRAAVFKDNRIL
ncbi:MAG: NUDIX hydrolase N-terminal domain-containing protein, partial [Enterococcus sp.]|nr:NUDIX hydrolase N-terminal domain-containing protein [Enterococcus sp.]